MTQLVHRSGPLVGLQRRFMELGRIRLGDRGPKGAPRKLTHFRLTSASRALLEAAASVYGGKVREWQDAPDEGVFELYTEASELDIILPPVFSDRDGSPTLPYSQSYEMWSGGGCVRRCDGETEVLSGKPCACGEARGTDPKTTCQITTRLNVMLPKLPGLGVWRLESRGWNAASLLPGTLDLLLLAASQQRFIPAVLRLEQRTSKKGGQTRKFVVPVVDLPEFRIGEVLERGLVSATQPLAINGPAPAPPRPELPAGQDPPAEPERFDNDDLPDFGEPPEIAGEVVEADAGYAPDPSGVDGLWRQLTDALVALGAEQSIEQVNAKAAIGDVAWLERNLARARLRLAEKGSAEGPEEPIAGSQEGGVDDGTPAGSSTPPPSAEQSSFFEERARQAQQRRAKGRR